MTDYAEVNTHHTDPLKPDSDDDFINDGDEIAMGLNPLSSQTFGVPDSQYTFAQTISSTKLEDINTDNLYELQIGIQSAGNANTSLKVNESLSSTNNAILGKPVELNYDGNLKFDEMTMTFVLDTNSIGEATGAYDDPELAGIKRFQIFHFDEATGSLSPVETVYDTVNNTLSATVTELGDYMLIDLDLWMYTLGIVPESETPDPVMSAPVQPKFDSGTLSVIDPAQGFSDSELSAHFDSIVSQQVENALGRNLENLNNSSAAGSSQYNKQIDLVFAINVRATTGPTSTGGVWTDTAEIYRDTRTMLQGTALQHLQMSIIRTVSRLYAEKGISSNVCIVSFGGSSDCTVHRLNGSQWLKTSEQVRQTLLSVTNAPAGGRHLDTLETIMNLPFRANVPKFVVLITNNEIVPGSNTCGKTLEEIANELKAANIIPLVVAPARLHSSVESFCNITGGAGWNALAFDMNDVKDGVVQIHGFVDYIETRTQDQVPTCTYISSHDLSVINLYEPLTKNGSMDTDGDGLTDWEEVDEAALNQLMGTSYNDGDIITDLPTYGEYLAHYNTSSTGLGSKSASMLNTRVLPIKSDPGKKDSDGDGLHDGARLVGNTKAVPKDPHPFKYDGPVGAKAIWDEQFRMQYTGDNTSSNYATAAGNVGEFLKHYYEAIFPHFNITVPVLNALADLGSLGLMFGYDDKNLALHSDPVYQWQQVGGYNDFYDNVFEFFTSMDKTKLDFNSGGQDYVVWAWKGNYLNIGPGAEVGFYTKANNLADAGVEHWLVTDTFPMTLSLYRRFGQNTFSNYCNWQPTDEQWWITTFVPPWDFTITKDKLLMVGSVDFSGSPRDKAFYSALKESDSARDNHKRLIFDDEGETLWILW